MRTERPRGGEVELVPPHVEQARRTLWTGLLVFRWAFYVLMVFNAITLIARFNRSIPSDALTWLGVVVAGAWTVWLTIDAHQERPETPYVDVVIAVGLILASSFVVPQGAVTGRKLFYAVAYPSNAALLCGAARGPVGGLSAGLVLSIALVIGRPLNGIDLLDTDELLSLANGCVYYLAAGAATGVFSMLFSRWAAEFRTMAERSFRDHERATKLAERQSLAREIHDSVLQGLAQIVRLGSRMIDQDVITRHDVQRITDMAREEERALRDLVMREPEDAPEGYVSFRERLAQMAAATAGIPVTVSAAGSVSLPIHHADELASAVAQALDNVMKHAGATRAAVFLDADAEDVIVSVRDNGTGFVYEEAALEAAGKAGILKSMKGRVADLGGRMRIESMPGLGTEIEFRVPIPPPLSEGGRA